MLVNSIPIPLHGRVDSLLPKGTRAEVFQQIFIVFLVLGTLVTVVVVGYMLYTAYRYRDGGETRDARDDFDPPTVGKLPTNDGGGRKLLLSFTLSAIIVISLVSWTYGTLLYVEGGEPAADAGGDGNTLDVEVVGTQFSWTFVYPNGHESNTLRAPEGATVELHVTSGDVFHTFGIPEHRVKTDAIPGQYTDTWFIADEEGTYEARCYELCGAGHSEMTAEVIVMDPGKYQEWYGGTNGTQNGTGNGTANSSANGQANQTSSTNASAANATTNA